MKRVGHALAMCFTLLLAMLGASGLIALVVAPFQAEGTVANDGFTSFYLGLHLLDPTFWDCARNTLFLAVTVAGIAWLVASLGLWIGWNEPRALHGLRHVARSSIAFPPLVAALGMRALFRGMQSTDAIHTEWLCWIGVVCVQLLWAVPFVACGAGTATRDASARWRDSALLAGGHAGVARARWRVLHALARPLLVRRTALVMLLVAAEPAAPLILGTRPLLAPTIVMQAAGGSTLAGIALQVGLILCATVAVCSLLAGSGSSFTPPIPLAARRVATGRESASRISMVQTSVLIAWIVASWAPVWALATSGSVTSRPAEMWESLAHNLEVGRSLGTTVLFASATATLALVASFSIDPVTYRSPVGRLLAALASLPTLVAGVAMMALLEVARVWMPAVRRLPDWPPFGEATVPLTLLFAWLLVPSFVQSRAVTRVADPALADRCRLLGARGVRAWWMVRGRAGAWPMLRRWVAAALLVAFDGGAVLLFTRTCPDCMLGPALLQLDATPLQQDTAAALGLASLCLLAAAHIAGARQAWFGVSPIEYNVRT